MSPRWVPPSTPRRIAIHEAGHAVAYLVFGIPVRDTTIRARAQYAGRTRARVGPDVPPLRSRKGWRILEQVAVVKLAGVAAEEVFDFDPFDDGCGGLADIRFVEKLLIAETHGDAAAFRKLALRRWGRAIALVKAHRRAVERVARALRDKRTLTGEEVRALVGNRTGAP